MKGGSRTMSSGRSSQQHGRSCRDGAHRRSGPPQVWRSTHAGRETLRSPRSAQAIAAMPIAFRPGHLTLHARCRRPTPAWSSRSRSDHGRSTLVVHAVLALAIFASFITDLRAPAYWPFPDPWKRTSGRRCITVVTSTLPAALGNRHHARSLCPGSALRLRSTVSLSCSTLGTGRRISPGASLPRAR